MMKKLSFQIKFPASFQDSSKTRLDPILTQVSSKFPKIKSKKFFNFLSGLEKQGLRQVSRFLEKGRKNFQVFNCLNLGSAYLYDLYLSFKPPPPPYTMEGNNPPSIYGGDQLWLSPQILKQKMRNQ